MNNSNVRLINPLTMAKPTGYTHVAEVTGGRMVYISGQVALDQSGNLVGKGDLHAQSVQVFENLKAALASVGADFSNVVKFSFFLLDISQMAVVREVRNQYIEAENPPASTAVAVVGLVSPDWLIEVEAVASLPA